MYGTKINYDTIDPLVVGLEKGYKVYINSVQLAKYYEQSIKRVVELIKMLGDGKYVEIHGDNPFTPNTIMVDATEMVNNLYGWFENHDKTRELSIFIKHELEEIKEEIALGALDEIPQTKQVGNVIHLIQSIEQ